MVIIGKDDRLAEQFTAVGLDAVLHQFFENFTAGVLVEYLLEEFLFRDSKVRRRRLVNEVFVELPFLVLGQLIIFDSSLQQFRGSAERFVVYKVFVFDCFFQGVIKVRNAGFTSENAVCVGIHFALRRRSKSYEQTIEIGENRAVLVEDGTVCLINDDQIEATGCEAFILCIDIVDHRLICTEHETGIIVLFLIA